MALFLSVRQCGTEINARIAHAIGLKHDNMAHPGRLIGAGGTALLRLITVVYGIGLGADTLLLTPQ